MVQRPGRKYPVTDAVSKLTKYSSPCSMSYSLSDLMSLITMERGEAIHLHDGEAPVLEIHQELHRIEGPSLEGGDTQTLLRSIAPSEEFREAMGTGLAAFTYRYGDAAFFHVMAFKEADSLRLELRRII